MIYVIKAIGIIYLAAGVILIVRPSLIRSIIDYFKVDKRIYIGGAARLVFGVLLLIATPQASFPWITGIIGVIITIAGIMIFALGVQRIHGVMDKMHAKPDNILRIPPAILAVLGILLIYAA